MRHHSKYKTPLSKKRKNILTYSPIIVLSSHNTNNSFTSGTYNHQWTEQNNKTWPIHINGKPRTLIKFLPTSTALTPTAVVPHTQQAKWIPEYHIIIQTPSRITWARSPQKTTNVISRALSALLDPESSQSTLLTAIDSLWILNRW
jgi:hypothetical protein